MPFPRGVWAFRAMKRLEGFPNAESPTQREAGKRPRNANGCLNAEQDRRDKVRGLLDAEDRRGGGGEEGEGEGREGNRTAVTRRRAGGVDERGGEKGRTPARRKRASTADKAGERGGSPKRDWRLPLLYGSG